MQEKVQVNQVLHELSEYGLLLYILAFSIFSDMICHLIMDMAALNYISITLSSFKIIAAISKWVLSILAIIIIFFLMLKAININSIAKTSATNAFSIFSILWFIFYIIGQIFYWIEGFESSNNLNINFTNRSIFFNWAWFSIVSLALIFQLIIWISLRSFFIENSNVFSATHSKKIRSYLIFLIITYIIMLYSSTMTVILNQIFSFSLNYNYVYPWYMAFFIITDIFLDILLIFGYSMLGYRIRELKNSTDILTHKR